MSRGTWTLYAAELYTLKTKIFLGQETKTGKAPTPDCPVTNLFTNCLNVTVVTVVREQHNINDSFNTWALGQWGTETLAGLVLAL